MEAPHDQTKLGRAYTAPSITVSFDLRRCLHYAECIAALPDVFDPTRRPWIKAELAEAETVAEVVRRCPTGALHYRLTDGDPEEPARPTTITPEPGGPLLVRGDLVLETRDGGRHETRAALCRCGRTRNEPFCDAACEGDAQSPAGTRE